MDLCKSGDRVEVVGTLLPTPNHGPREAKSQGVSVYILATSVQVISKNKTLARCIKTEEADFVNFLE